MMGVFTKFLEKKSIWLLTILSVFFMIPQTIMGQTDDVSPLLGKISPPPGADKYGSFEQGLIPFLNNILRLFFLAAGLYAFINLMFAGFLFMKAGGDPKKIQSAWGKIWQSFVGLLILVSSFLIAAIIGIVLFGSPTVILNPQITGAPNTGP